MSRQARRVVRERFSFETMLREYETLIHFHKLKSVHGEKSPGANPYPGCD
jgi:hypothetical protein